MIYVKFTCRNAHRLVSERLDRELSMIERCRLNTHLMICRTCRDFGGQMGLLRKAMRQAPFGDGPADEDDPS